MQAELIEKQLKWQICQQSLRARVLLASLTPWLLEKIKSQNPLNTIELQLMIEKCFKELVPKLSKVDNLLNNLFKNNNFRSLSYEDARQEVAKIIFKYLTKKGGGDVVHPAAWVYRVGSRVIVALAKKEPKIQELYGKDDDVSLEELLDVALARKQEPSTPYLYAQLQELYELIRGILTENERKLISLYILEIPYEEIARQLSIEIGTARTRVNRIKGKLGQHYIV